MGVKCQNLVVVFARQRFLTGENFSSLPLVFLDPDSKAILHQIELNTIVFSSYRCFSAQLARSSVNSPQM